MKVTWIMFFFFSKVTNFLIWCHIKVLNNIFVINIFVVLFTLQEAIVKIMKMRKKITNAQLQTELVEILKNMFLPSKKMIKEQIEWLIEHKYMKRDEDNINVFIYMAWVVLWRILWNRKTNCYGHIMAYLGQSCQAVCQAANVQLKKSDCVWNDLIYSKYYTLLVAYFCMNKTSTWAAHFHQSYNIFLQCDKDFIFFPLWLIVKMKLDVILSRRFVL